MLDFSSIRAVVLDMDGVLWRGDQPLSGLADTFAFFRQRGLPFVLATNNSGRTPADYIAKLANMGVNGVGEGSIVTSGTATVDYLKRHYPAGSAIHVMGGEGLEALVAEAGFRLADEDVRAVVAGIDFRLSYERLKRATRLIRAGADFIGTNGDVTFPAPDGVVPGAGSMLAALAAASERQPVVIGKPDAPMFEAALHTLHSDPAHTLMVGDRIDTDIAGAQAVGLRTALVLTGVTTPAALAASPVQPDAVYADLVELIAAWRA